MGNPDSRWPRLQEYQAAIISAETDFKDERLRGLRVQRHPTFSWDAWPRAGNFGVVFKIAGGNAAYALKVFYNPQEDRQLRYQLIDTYLRDIPVLRRLVSFAYDETGIRVGDREYPTLRMDWASGDALDICLGDHLSTSGRIDNGKFLTEWVATVRELQGAGIAHGDLQHKNILLQSDGTFRLVDYDGMFVPGMRQYQLAACEAGVAAYQHPQRKYEKDRFDERMDDFSALVILMTLACADADLWQRYHKEGRLLVSEEDLLHPSDSGLLTELSGRPDAIGTLASLVGTAASQNLDRVPSFASVVKELRMEGTGQRQTSSRQPSAGPRGPDVTAIPDASAAKPTPLTYQQRQVARLLAEGKGVDEIAAALGLFRARVQEHIQFLERLTGPDEPPVPAASPTPAPSPPSVPARVLSVRQQQVLRLLNTGLTPGQIAARLHLQPATVNRHIAAIRAAVGADEVRKLLDRAVAKQTAAEQTPAKQTGAKPAEVKPAGGKPTVPTQAGTAAAQSPRPAPAPPRPVASPPSPAPQPVPSRTPQPASTGSNAAAVIWVLLAIIALVGVVVFVLAIL